MVHSRTAYRHAHARTGQLVEVPDDGVDPGRERRRASQVGLHVEVLKATDGPLSKERQRSTREGREAQGKAAQTKEVPFLPLALTIAVAVRFVAAGLNSRPKSSARPAASDMFQNRMFCR